MCKAESAAQKAAASAAVIRKRQLGTRLPPPGRQAQGHLERSAPLVGGLKALNLGNLGIHTGRLKRLDGVQVELNGRGHLGQGQGGVGHVGEMRGAAGDGAPLPIQSQTGKSHPTALPFVEEVGLKIL